VSNPADHFPAQTRRVQRSHQPTGPAQGGRSPDRAPVHPAAAVRTKPVRRSVDLSPAYHAELTAWCARTAEEIGATRVTGQDVIRALVARLLMDENLSRRIRADLSMNI
jgi:hypothetical protein